MIKMVFERDVLEKYENLKDNLANLLVLREDLISIRDDISSDDKYKIKLLYKKNIEYLIEIQKSLESDIMELFRAKEILNYLRFENDFINLTQIIKKIENERHKTKFSINSNKSLDKKAQELYFMKDLIDVDEKIDDISDETFKDIAKCVSPNINITIDEKQKELWKKALKAKSDNETLTLKNILKDANKNIVKDENFSADILSKDISNIKKNLEILNKETREITNLCKKNFDKEQIKNIESIVNKIEEKRKDLIYSIDTLTNIKENLLTGFLMMLPGNQNRLFN
ncbi:hypothetical protein HMPREF3188_01101 [Tissierellia bacterium KA00581]|nr:hypothetical protein HMPREF3188_01101 [Tissierellia bacterium KA00581]